MGRWRALRAELAPAHAHVMAHQVHGNAVLWHDEPRGWVIHDGADGHATATPGVMLLVTVADCVPIYLVAPGARAVALLHAGWRGTAAGILERGLALLGERAGVSPRDVVMHAGVAISGPAYEVGAEVMAGVGLPTDGPGPWHLDLRSVLVRQADRLGLGEVTVSGHCTATEAGVPSRGSREARTVGALSRLTTRDPRPVRPLTTPSPDG
jgi:YfiH family protein